jgi:hypothetical protein
MRTRILGVCSLLAWFAAAPVNAQCNDDFILISTWDDFSSRLSTLDPVTKTATINVDTTSSVAELRTFGSRAYALNFAGSIQILDPCDDFTVISSFTTGGEPRDLVFVSPTVGYVTRYGGTSLLKIDQDGVGTGAVDLSMFADADGLPEMDQMFAYEGRLYICVQRVISGNPAGTSYLAVLDIATGTLIDMDPVAAGIQGIPLLHPKPKSEINLRVHGGLPKAYFSAVGFGGINDGGVIECVANDPSQQSVIFTEVDAGGDIRDVEIVSDTKGFAIVEWPAQVFVLVSFDPSTGIIGAVMHSAPGQSHILNDIEPSSLGLLLSSHTQLAPAGIRCFDMTTGAEIPGGPIGVGLAPWDILVRDGSTTGVGDTPSVTTLGQNYPNPFNPETSIPFTLAREGRVVLQVFDANGRLVATLLDENRSAGQHVAHWNGRDARGRVSSSGVYFARLETRGSEQTRKLVLLK